MKSPTRLHAFRVLPVLAILWGLAHAAPGLAADGPASAAVRDADGDGLPDAVEEQLGTDPNCAERLVTLGTFPARSPKRPELDIVRVDFGNVAKDRWLWAIHFAKPYTFDNAQLILYLDADNNPQTGRKDMGCEWMLSHHGGQPSASGFAPDGANRQARAPRVALAKGVLYLCHDGPIRQDQGRSVFRVSVLSETQHPVRGASSVGWIKAAGPANSERKPARLLLDDITEDENFQTTEGLDLVWKLQADPANVVLSSVTAELKGMAYYDTEYRWPAVRGANGSITLTVPRAGKFYPAVVVYDTPGAEAYELLLDGKRLGRFLAAEDDNRQRIHFLSQPVELRGGDKLVLRTGNAGSHITEDVLLLAQKPPVRGRAFEVGQLKADYVERSGQAQLRLNWITTWPAQCIVEYGPTERYGSKLSEADAQANHRVWLAGLRPGETVHWRIVAPKSDAASVVSPDQTVVFAPPAPPAVKPGAGRVALTVENPSDFALADYPVTSGVPFAQGELASPENVRLLDAAGREMALQPKVAARWQDGSVKWLHVSFLASGQAKSQAAYTLQYGSEVRRMAEAKSIGHQGFGTIGHQQAGDRLAIFTGPLRVEFDRQKSGFPTAILFGDSSPGQPKDAWDLTGGQPIGAQLVDTRQNRYTTNLPAQTIEIEEAGPVRIVVKTTGRHAAGAKQSRFSYVNRFTFYAGSPLVRMDYTWINDAEEAPFAEFSSIGMHLPLPAGPTCRWTVGLGGGNVASGQGELSLRQLRDNAFELTPSATVGAKTERADGWIDLSQGSSGVTVAVRDFWQLYPKALRLAGDGLWLDLCPRFAPGTYDQCSQLDEIRLFYYLMGGKYKVAQGVQKRHEMMLYFHRGGFGPDARQMARVFQEPLIAACTPQRYAETRVFGEILPATANRFPEYEKVCEQVYRGYLRHQEGLRAYGMLNFGDQWGERKVNWANGEYDHHHAFLLQFARSAQRRWYFLGEKAARHAIDIDTCHHGPRRGGEWIHSMGHTGGYFKQQYQGDGIPSPGMSVSHTWTEGFYDWYCLSGDPEGAENAALVADHYDGAYLNNYDWGNCRTNGWHLLLTLAAYRATSDPYYLNAARIIVERTLERQTPGGGWHRQMVPGHCHDMPRHRGEANFMLGVLANGLEEYYREVPDPRVAQAILGGAKQAATELWVDESNGFRYTSCPNMKGYTANNDMTSEILFFARRLGGDPKYGELALRAMRAAFAGGIGSVAHLRWTPHILYNMDLLEREKKAGK